jgi:hypothetical protein
MVNHYFFPLIKCLDYVILVLLLMDPILLISEVRPRQMEIVGLCVLEGFQRCLMGCSEGFYSRVIYCQNYGRKQLM